MTTSKKLLICAACAGELKGSPSIYSHINPDLTGACQKVSDVADVMISGVGMFQTGYHVAKAAMSGTYGLILLAGIAGAYRRDIELCTPLMVESCAFADCATENEDGSMNPVVGSMFLSADIFPFTGGLITSDTAKEIAGNLGIGCARCNTVNRINTAPENIRELLSNYPADIETMESAAAAYSCAMEGVRYAELRCVSNYALPKRESKWMIKEAIEKLGSILEKLLENNGKILHKYLA